MSLPFARKIDLFPASLPTSQRSVEDSASILFAQRQGQFIHNAKQEWYVFTSEDHGILVVCIPSVVLPTQEQQRRKDNQASYSTIYTILFSVNKTLPSFYPTVDALTLYDLFQAIFSQTAFPVNTQASDCLANVERTTVSGVDCIAINRTHLIFEHPSQRSGNTVVAAHLHKTLPTQRSRFPSHSVIAHVVAYKKGKVRPGQEVMGKNARVLQDRLLSRYYWPVVVQQKTLECFRRTMKIWIRITIALLQTLAAIVIWVNGETLHWGFASQVIFWILSLLVSVNGSARLSFVLEAYPIERASLKHHILCVWYALLGAGTLTYQQVFLLTFPRSPDWSFAHVLSAVLLVLPLVLPALLLSEAVCFVYSLSVERAKRDRA